ncbi:ABC transporter permease [Mycobacterium sp. 852002-40037_SCH5390672]|uniref:ABC transporter permease n=1 Tax=Mycobacterium sp. 852002-40037_SCH5390672 TaxID=1834089 RepID=UPI0018D36763|nr:FtsX-like permease family protein [Mycobacterium sp. 852002-40037_SCH5390672]
MSNLIWTVSKLAEPLRSVPLFVASPDAEQIPTGPVLPAGLDSRLRQIPQVSTVIAGQYAYATYAGRRILVQGTMPGGLTAGLDRLPASTRTAFFRGDGVLISRQLAGTAGDSITLATPNGPKTARIIGVVDFLTFDAGMVAMPLADLQNWFSRPGATYLELHLRRGANVAETQRAIASVLGSGLHVYGGDASYSAAMRAVAQVGALSVAVQLIIAVVVTVGIFNTFLLSVIERQKEIAVFRAIGARRGLIYRATLAEAMTIGVVGGVIGTVIGLLTQFIGVTVLSTSIGLIIDFRAQPIFWAYPVVAVLLCAAAAVGAAMRAGRTNIIDSIADQ